MNNSYNLNNDSPLTANGRFGRLSYIAWNCLSNILAAVAVIFFFIFPALRQSAGQSLPTISIIILGIISLTLVYFTIIFAIRRLHDRNHSGWLVLFLLVPLLNVLLALYLLFAPGTPSTNNFGSQRPTAGWETVLAWLYLILIMINFIGLAFT